MIKVSLLLLACTLIGLSRLTAADSSPISPPVVPTPAKPEAATVKTDTTVKKTDVLAAYLKVSAALAADNLADAKTAAAALGVVADKGGQKDIATQATAVSKGASIAAVRATFKTLSTTVEAFVKGEKDYIVMYCPMADADWVQTSKEVRNPYYGKSMLTCGGPKTTK